MKKKKTYFKGLDANLQGHDGFQYEIGKTYSVATHDPWRWLHYTSHIETAIQYGRRIVEVKPVTGSCYYGADDICAQSIYIVRELDKEEILTHLELRHLKKKDVRFCMQKMGW